MITCQRSDVDDLIGGPDDLFVVFDYDDRVSQVTQAQQDIDKPVCVTGVKADAGLVEDIHRADEVTAQRCGQVDALGFTAGQCR